jgi:hypothetical protein
VHNEKAPPERGQVLEIDAPPKRRRQVTLAAMLNGVYAAGAFLPFLPALLRACNPPDETIGCSLFNPDKTVMFCRFGVATPPSHFPDEGPSVYRDPSLSL